MGRILVAGAVYGASIGAWTGPTMAGYSAVKLPFVQLATAAVTCAFNTIAAAASGAELGVRRVASTTLGGMGVAAVVLASMAPVVLLFSLSLPPPQPARVTTHNVLYLVHTITVAGAGLVGVGVLYHQLRLLLPRGAARRLVVIWVASLALVGGEVAWASRPFIGSVHLEPRLFRKDALDGNVYEFIWTDIRPHLLKRRPPSPPGGSP